MSTTILSLITDHIKFLEQSKQAEGADQVKQIKQKVYSVSGKLKNLSKMEMCDKNSPQVRLQLVLVILLFSDLDNLLSDQLQQLLGSLLQVIFSFTNEQTTKCKKNRSDLEVVKNEKLVRQNV